MDFLRQHKTLYNFVSAVLAVSLVVYCFGFYAVQAAEISTLPADIDITVNYDADSINWTYDGKDYSFDRNTRIGYYYGDDFYYSSNGYAGVSSLSPDSSGNSYNYTVEKNTANFRDSSYWFSPSENALYIIRAHKYNSSVYGLVRSFASGTFGFLDRRCLTARYDFNDNSFVFGGLDDRYKYTTADSFYYYDPAAGFRLDNNRLYFNDETKYTCHYPSDLLCLYSTYAISGFYEPDTSKVNTPDYYFNYQYIFYRDGKGYTFVDSAQPLTEVTAQGSYAYLTFADTCNKYIYTSPDGITWTTQTRIDTMYGGTFTQLSYDWFYDKTTVGSVNQYDAELVYTCDDKFGDKPLITPDWGDLTDITDNLNKFLDDYDIINTTGRGSFINSFDYYCVEFPSDNAFFGSFVGTLTMSYVNYAVYEKVIGSDSTFPDYCHVYYFGGDVPSDISPVYNVDTGHWLLDILSSAPSITTSYYTLKTSTQIPTLSMYLRLLNNSASNIDLTLSAFREDSYDALKSIFDNITLTNTHLSALTDKLGKLPDYTAALRDISSKLDNLDLLSPDSSGGSVFAPFDDTAILGRFDVANDYLKDIKGLETGNLLTNILNLLTGTDGEGMKVTINPNFKLDLDNNLKASFSAKIDKLFDEIFKINASLDKIAEFNLGSGGTDKDYSPMLTLINDNLYTASGRIYDLNQSLDQIRQTINSIDLSVEFPEAVPKNDLFYDDPDSDEDLIDFVSEYAKTALDKSYFASFVTFDSDTTSAIQFYNGLSEDTFKALGPLGAVLLIPVGFILVGTAVRRHT